MTYAYYRLHLAKQPVRVLILELKSLLTIGNQSRNTAPFESPSVGYSQLSLSSPTTSRLPLAPVATQRHYQELPKTTPPPLCEQIDFPNVRFWTKNSWTDYTKDEDKRGRKVSVGLYLTDEQGEQLSKDQMDEIGMTTKAAWVQMALANSLPKSWRLISQVAADYFYNTVMAAHPEFSFAEGPWKARAYAIASYPNWIRYHGAEYGLGSGGESPAVPRAVSPGQFSLVHPSITDNQAL